jgi:hypothetical protein
MADRTPLRAAKPSDIADDDPFAELTRIMGFDPRVPVKPQASSLKPVEPAMGEDFEIDLEKELMGELDDGQGAETHSAQAVQPAQEAHQPEISDFDFGEEIAASLERDSELHVDAHPHEAFRAASQDAEPAVAEHEDFDEAVAHSFASDFEPEIEPAHDHSGGFERDAAPAAQDGRRESHGEPELAEAESHLESVAHEAARYEGFGDEGFGDDFDRAMAEVDMDFGHDAGQAGLEPSAQEEDAGGAQVSDAFTASADHDPFEDDFEFDLRNELNSAPQIADIEAEPVHAAVEEQAVEEQRETVATAASPAQETTLEDELNALLNRMSAKPAISPVAAEVLQVPDEAAPAADEANWTVDDEQEAQAPQEDALFDAAFGQDFVPEANAGVEAHADEGDIDFDGDAFAAALNDEVAADTDAHYAGEAPARETDDPVDALRSFAPHVTPAQGWSRGSPFIQPQSAQEAPAYAATTGAEAFSATAEEPVVHASSPSRPDMPEVETVEVPERVVALADDLDIPDFAFEEKTTEAAGYDELDAEFADLLNEMNDADPAPVASRAKTYDDDAYDAGFRHDPFEAPAYVEQRSPAASAEAAAAAYVAAAASGFGAGADGKPAINADAAGMDDLDYDPNFDEELSVPDAAEAEAARQPRNRGLMIAAVVGAVAVIGGVGALAFSSGGKGGSGAPVLVKADNQPIKVKPENPGGTVIPNQDNKVYDVVAHGAKPTVPEQKNLVADAEEPVDVNARAPQGSNLPPAADEEVVGQKSEARLQPTVQKADTSDEGTVAAVAPRKVRTMVVKPDGSLVPREDVSPAANVAASEPADPAPQHVVNASNEDQTGTVPQAASAEAQQDTAGSRTPATAPVAPQRPADQPVDVVGQTKPEKVASIAPESAASGGWSMQIASQPSAESAQSTYQDLARRYGSVLSGHGVNIVKAEVAGKGTFYRVRVPAKSRDEAINLCTSYKAAGGNCFVSK